MVGWCLGIFILLRRIIGIKSSPRVTLWTPRLILLRLISKVWKINIRKKNQFEIPLKFLRSPSNFLNYILFKNPTKNFSWSNQEKIFQAPKELDAKFLAKFFVDFMYRYCFYNVTSNAASTKVLDERRNDNRFFESEKNIFL